MFKTLQPAFYMVVAISYGGGGEQNVDGTGHADRWNIPLKTGLFRLSLQFTLTLNSLGYENASPRQWHGL